MSEVTESYLFFVVHVDADCILELHHHTRYESVPQMTEIRYDEQQAGVLFIDQVKPVLGA